MSRIGGYAIIQSVLTSAARTTNGQSSWYNVEEFEQLNMYIDVTAVSGTGASMKIQLQESPDQSTVYDLEEQDVSQVSNFAMRTREHTKYIRIKYILTGITPSFTFKADYGARA